MEPMGLLAAMQHFFGRKNGQGLKEFAEETRKLTEQDKAEIQAGLEQNGYIIK